MLAKLNYISQSQIVMSPHEQAEEFVSHYLTIMQGDNETSTFQKILEMKVRMKKRITCMLLLVGIAT